MGFVSSMPAPYPMFLPLTVSSLYSVNLKDQYLIVVNSTRAGVSPRRGCRWKNKGWVLILRPRRYLGKPCLATPTFRPFLSPIPLVIHIHVQNSYGFLSESIHDNVWTSARLGPWVSLLIALPLPEPPLPVREFATSGLIGRRLNYLWG